MAEEKPTITGRVQVFHNNGWKAVCNRNVDVHSAQVMCRMLGLSAGATEDGLEHKRD